MERGAIMYMYNQKVFHQFAIYYMDNNQYREQRRRLS